MSYEETQGPDGVTMVKITTQEGKIYKFRKPSTKPLDPKLKLQNDLLDKSFREGFERAVRKARRLGKPLHEIVPVS